MTHPSAFLLINGGRTVEQGYLSSFDCIAAGAEALRDELIQGRIEPLRQ
jgi:hypothetical protein